MKTEDRPGFCASLLLRCFRDRTWFWRLNLGGVYCYMNLFASFSCTVNVLHHSKTLGCVMWIALQSNNPEKPSLTYFHASCFFFFVFFFSTSEPEYLLQPSEASVWDRTALVWRLHHRHWSGSVLQVGCVKIWQLSCFIYSQRYNESFHLEDRSCFFFFVFFYVITFFL